MQAEGDVIRLPNADGSEPRLLAEGVIGCVPANSWSPDSKVLACSRGREVVLLDVATGAMTVVGEGVDPIWIDDHTLLIEV